MMYWRIEHYLPRDNVWQPVFDAEVLKHLADQLPARDDAGWYQDATPDVQQLRIARSTCILANAELGYAHYRVTAQERYAPNCYTALVR